MKKGLIVLVVVIVAGVFAFIMLRGQDDTLATEVKLSQSIIDEAVAGCQNRTTWGIALADVRINYKTGVGVEGAIVLHNGDDTERLVTLSYEATSLPQLDGDTGEYYQPSPIAASGWVSLDTSQIRLETMGTEVVTIHFLVPKQGGGFSCNNPNQLPSRWEFRISATGAQIETFEQRLIVTSGVNDNEVVATLEQPLLSNDVSAVLSVTSDLPADLLYVKKYDPSMRGLTIGGLADSSQRLMTIKYEYPLVLRIAYGQRWLIRML
jgi:hypothetical protein